LPRGDGPFPVVVLVHGGFWRRPYGRRLMVGLARDVVQHGWAAWNIEYRRIGQQGGGWPGTLDDVAAAVDALADVPTLTGVEVPLDLSRVVAVGHSAGGHLALWLAARPGLPAGVPGAQPRVAVAAAVSQAGVADLVAGAEERLGRGACLELLGGGPDEVPDRYTATSPMARLPLGVPILAVHGDEDDRVPLRQSETFVAAARAAGDQAVLVALAGVDHFAVIDPAHHSWRIVTDFVGSVVD
jgi:acetyl esterase/lipase